MNGQVVAPYGSWKSPVTTDLVVRANIRLSQVATEGQHVYWIEGRPLEGGRNVLVRWSEADGASDLTPSPFDVRTTVHEYGGGSFCVRDGICYFSNFKDQRLYRQAPGEEPLPVTSATSMRFGDMTIDTVRNRIVAVREDHSTPGCEPRNTLVSIDLSGSTGGDVLVSGNDFYSSPRISPDGKSLAWLTWNHPNMPWDGTELWAASIAGDGSLTRPRKVAGGPSESIFQPEWSPDGTLYFVSDRTGWYNIYRERGEQIEAVTAMEAEFGRPQWGLGMTTYGFLTASRLFCIYCKRGIWYLASIDTRTLELTTYDTPYTNMADPVIGPAGVILLAGSATEAHSVIRFDPETLGHEVLRKSSNISVDPKYLSTPVEVTYPTKHGKSAYAFFYPPKNPDYEAPQSELPPVVVMSHGGPTGATTATYNLAIQYWTSRGIAVLDVNYGGSSNYGREYRDRLKGMWGITDVVDCVNAVRFMAERGEVDGKRAAIRGGSAGGYTTLAALTFTDVFKAGASYYGIGDLEALARDTHKFESRYLDGLIGPYLEQKQKYFERSPINYTHMLSCPVIFFQGLDDKVVPPNQAEVMVNNLLQKGLPVAYVPFEQSCDDV